MLLSLLLVALAAGVQAQNKTTRMGAVRLENSRDNLNTPIQRMVEIFPATFDAIWEYSNQGLTYARNGKLVGIIDTLGKIVIPIQYDKIEQSDWTAVLAVVSKNGNVSVVGRDGRQVLPPIAVGERKFAPYKLYPDEKLIAAYPQAGGPKVYTYGGKQLIPDVLNDIKFIENGLVGVTNTRGQWGVFDKNGQKKIAYGEHSQIWSKKGVDVLVLPVEGHHNVSAVLMSSTGYIPNTGKKFIEPYMWDNGPLIVTHDQFVMGHQGAIDTKSNVVIPFKYNAVKYFGNDSYKVTNTAGRVGLLNAKGEEIIPCKYEDIELYQPERRVSVVKNNGKFGVVTHNQDPLHGASKELTPIVYDKISGFNATGHSPVCENGKWGIMEVSGHLAIEPQYEEITYPDKNGVGAKKGGLWGIVGLENQPRHAFRFQGLFNLNGGLFGAMDQNKRIAIFNSRGHQLTHFKYLGVSAKKWDSNLWIVVEEVTGLPAGMH